MICQPSYSRWPETVGYILQLGVLLNSLNVVVKSIEVNLKRLRRVRYIEKCAVLGHPVCKYSLSHVSICSDHRGLFSFLKKWRPFFSRNVFDHFRAPRLLSTVAVQKLEVYRYVTTVVQCFINDVTDNIYKISSKKCKIAKKM